ncbi:hypothetical protein BDQ17DRAFT_1429360 [Cyathus striatus]|nr:hypothetical protein BDQ17DRAFT_1429360 [Cyathus striatus]
MGEKSVIEVNTGRGLRIIRLTRQYDSSITSSSPIIAFDPFCAVPSGNASIETSPFDEVVKEPLVKEGEIEKAGSALYLAEVWEEGEEGEEWAAEESSAETTASTKVNSTDTLSDERRNPPVVKPVTPARKLRHMVSNFVPHQHESSLLLPQCDTLPEYRVWNSPRFLRQGRMDVSKVRRGGVHRF